jgi:hypothetical protein
VRGGAVAGRAVAGRYRGAGRVLKVLLGEIPERLRTQGQLPGRLLVHRCLLWNERCCWTALNDVLLLFVKSREHRCGKPARRRNLSSLGCQPQAGGAAKIPKPRRAGIPPRSVPSARSAGPAGLVNLLRLPPGVDTPGWVNSALRAGGSRNPTLPGGFGALSHLAIRAAETRVWL